MSCHARSAIPFKSLCGNTGAFVFVARMEVLVFKTFQRWDSVQTVGRGSVEITRAAQAAVQDSGLMTGTCHVFVRHTSASLLITENADPRVRRDLETLLARYAPDADPAYEHDDEGDDDMAAHARSILTGSSVTVPIGQSKLLLGAWQGVFLYEHRTQPYERHIVFTLIGATTPDKTQQPGYHPAGEAP